MTRTTKTLLAALLVTGVALAAIAGPADDDLGFRGPPRFLRHLFSPRLVMANQEAIGLTDAQREAISKAVSEVQSKVTTVQWDLEKASEQLDKLLEGEHADESAVLTKADEMMALEQRMKRAHLAMLVAVKNQLTLEQQHKLEGLRPQLDRRRRFRPRRE